MDANRQAVAQMRRRIGERERAEIFARAGGRCHWCGERIDAGREAWSVDHVLALEMGGDEAKGSDNLKPIHDRPCHAEKTGRQDVPAIRKAQRNARRSMGIKRQPRRKMPYRKFNGEAVWND